MDLSVKMNLLAQIDIRYSGANKLFRARELFGTNGIDCLGEMDSLTEIHLSAKLTFLPK